MIIATSDPRPAFKSICFGSRRQLTLGLIALLMLLMGCRSEYKLVRHTAFKDSNSIAITFVQPVEHAWAENPASFTIYENQSPDILIPVQSATLSQNRKMLTLLLSDSINRENQYTVAMKEMRFDGKTDGAVNLTVRKSYAGFLIQILIGAMIIQNFVFSKYLGLCVFFGTSKKKSTAVGMGITFTIVIVFASLMSWFLYQFVLKPFHLDYLQIVVFIGLVSLTVQGVDTVLRKVNPRLFKAFGVYLVLVIANCIVIAVPLMLANNEYNLWESLMLALGAGLGFLIALFLMSSVRERLEFADIPKSFRGLPIAFIVAGLFALSFMGFSGMSIF